MSRLLVSFTTTPGCGSERGVGWAFVQAAREFAISHGEQVHIVFDARDECAVSEALAAKSSSQLVILHPVPLPAWALKRFGDSRSRSSYLSWLMRARREVKRICRDDNNVHTMHQVTFATGTLPAALAGSRKIKRVWGPIAVPTIESDTTPLRHPLLEPLAMRILRTVARINSRRVDIVIATNDIAAAALSAGHRSLQVEPNIAVDTVPQPEVRDDHLLSICGLLIERKRPWIALEVLTHPALQEYRLQVIGDGPLRSQLEALADKLDVADRVSFLGQLDHSEALKQLGASRLLLHPAAREGAAWVVGEAAAMGVPAVAFDSVGGATTVRMSANGGTIVAKADNRTSAFAEGVIRALQHPEPEPTGRWNSSRLPALLNDWWTD